MDNLTHSLFALTLARTRLRPQDGGSRSRTAVLLLASNAPDVDILAAFSQSDGSYLAAHRGATHGPIGIVALGLASALIVAAVERCAAGGRHADVARARLLTRLIALGLLGTVCHVLLDVPTPYGTRLLSPFSGRWYALDWMPIIDVYLWMLLAGGLVIGRLMNERRAAVAALTLSLMAVNYMVHAAGHATAVHRGGGTAPWRIQSWNGGPVSACTPGRDETCAAVAALPTFAGPFTWDILRPVGGGYELFELDLRSRARPRTIVVNNEENRWVETARASRLGAIFYGFARFPAATVRSAPDGVTVRVRDVRYTGPTDDARSQSPFVVSFEFDHGGNLRQARLGR